MEVGQKGRETSDDTEAKIARFRQYVLDEAGEGFDHHINGCESPIEKLFLAYAITCGRWRIPSPPEHSGPSELLLGVGARTWRGLHVSSNFPDCFFVFQLEISAYRVDFAFYSCGMWCAIELDGHEFHEKTKEQAQNDKSRDRRFVMSGWRVLRYTGSEVYRNVHAVWEQIEAFLYVGLMAKPGEAVDAVTPGLIGLADVRADPETGPIVAAIRAADGNWDEQMRLLQEAEDVARRRNGLPPRLQR